MSHATLECPNSDSTTTTPYVSVNWRAFRPVFEYYPTWNQQAEYGKAVSNKNYDQHFQMGPSSNYVVLRNAYHVLRNIAYILHNI